MTQAGATTYSYGAKGNMISKTDNGVTTNYIYDYANRLITIQNPQSKIQNSYDGYGRRISRLVKGGGFGIPEAQYTEYLWDGTNVLCEFYQNQNNPLEYIYGNGQLISRDDLLILPVSGRTVHQNTHWFHQDGLGSVVNLTDGAGNVKLSYNYDAFGEITMEEGAVGWKKNRYTFTGKPYDPQSGMYYFGARWYEAEVGRFITKDLWTWRPDDERITGNNLFMYPLKQRGYYNLPNLYVWQLHRPRISSYLNSALVKYFIVQQGITNPKVFHRYVYCANNPINYIDPYGFSWLDRLGKIVKAMADAVLDIPLLGPAEVAIEIGEMLPDVIERNYEIEQQLIEMGVAKPPNRYEETYNMLHQDQK